MKPIIVIGLCASTMAISVSSHADDKAVCLAASSQGQTLRDGHQLIEARDQFRQCARAQCPNVVQKDCTQWLDEVERNLPTVVVSAKDGSGADLVAVSVTMDGRPLTAKLDGQAITLNPGPHVFRFELADGTSADQQVLVREGEKNQSVIWALRKAEPPVGPAKPLPASTTAPAETVAPVPAAIPPAEAPTAARGQGAPWKAIGFVLGGAGIVGLGVGTIFGVQAMSNKNSANCVNNYCDPGPLSDARNAATLSTVGFVAGGALLAVGAAAALLAPNGSDEKAGSVRAGPWVASNGGGLVVRGRW